MVGVGVVVLMVLIVLVQWNSIQTKRKLDQLDALNVPSPSAEQLQQTHIVVDELLAIIGNSPDRAMGIIDHQPARGSIAARLRLIAGVNSFPALLILARLEKDSAPAGKIAILQTFQKMWQNDDPPHSLPDWTATAATESTTDTALRREAIVLLGRFAEENCLRTLKLIAERDPNPEIRTAALDGMTLALNSGKFPSRVNDVLTMLKGPIAQTVATHPGLNQILRSRATISMIRDIAPLLAGAVPEVRTLCLQALSGGGITIRDGKDGQDSRNLLTPVMVARLGADVPPLEVVAALTAVTQLKLYAAREVIFARIPAWIAAPSPGIDIETLAKVVGEGLIDSSSRDGIVASVPVIEWLTSAVNDDALRPLAAKSLSKLTARDASRHEATLAAVTALAAHADQPDCAKALHVLVGTVFARGELLTRMGTNKTQWSAWIAKQTPRFKRLTEIQAYTVPEAALHTGAPRKLINDTMAYLDAVRSELAGWLNDPQFDYPLGTEKGLVADLHRRMNEMFKAVNSVRMTAKD